MKNTIDELSVKIEVLNVSPNRAYKTLKFINTSALTYKRALAKILKEAEKINADAVIGVAQSPVDGNVSCTAYRSYTLYQQM